MGRCITGIELKTILGEFSGDADAVYPSMRLIATQKYARSYALFGLQLSSSLVIFGSNRGGVVLVIGNDARKLTVSNSINSPISHITQANSLTAPIVVPIPTSKVSSLSFGAYGIPIRAMTPISLYAFADGTSGNDIFAIVSLQVAEIVG